MIDGGNFTELYVSRNFSPSRDLMRVNDVSVNEKMVDKVNVKNG